MLEKYEIPIVASVLKLYLLELPGLCPQCEDSLRIGTDISADSLVSSQVYEIIKTIYSTTAHETTEEGRIKVLQSTLGQLRLNNIATLDAIMTHFTRLIDLTSADEAYIAALAQTLAPCILRPRIESSLTMNERHSYRLMRDLFAHKDAIFDELKRQSSSLGLGAGGQPRLRAISTDESNRRAAMEARNRAIANRSRATSPAPGSRHRRDRSTDGSRSTRFPINLNSPKTKTRHSLEVPSSNESSPAGDRNLTKLQHNVEEAINGASSESANSETTSAAANSTETEATNGSDDSPTPTPTPAPVPSGTVEVEKRDSLTRIAGRVSRKPGLSRGSVTSLGSGTGSNRNSVVEASEPLKPVTLEDKPMDD